MGLINRVNDLIQSNLVAVLDKAEDPEKLLNLLIHEMQQALVSQYSPELAVYLFDFGVNSGTGRAAKFLQRLLNSLNHCGEHYPDIRVDGAVGRMTLQSLKGFYAKRGESGMNVLAHAVNGLRIAFCVGITEDNESQEVFAFGWLSRIVNL
ncbi:putative peptidoglycan-binding domain-containing protein [Bacteroides stercoris]|uniref:putative peptidoglycan-binding domain-containing protein n=1 Tax=Bacteroides stercoris TaxID=46506 RepID=UPI00125D636C|nr:putative peptidoglycan-binding domain-containing protein [Bacteroides stercoris]KAB5323722.1 hypothetical protein F9951_17905 [Bacteroides stercoris]